MLTGGGEGGWFERLTAGGIAFGYVLGLAGAVLYAVAGNVRHPACAYPGAGQAGGQACSARAAVAARGVAAHGAGMGNVAAARSRWFGVFGGSAGCAGPRGGGGAQRRPGSTDRADPEPVGGGGDPGDTDSGARGGRCGGG